MKREQVATELAVSSSALEHIDANDLERIAKLRPDECFLKGSGILKLTGAIRDLERRLRDIAGLVQWDELGATGPTIEALSWESVARMACDLARAPVVLRMGPDQSQGRGAVTNEGAASENAEGTQAVNGRDEKTSTPSS